MWWKPSKPIQYSDDLTHACKINSTVKNWIIISRSTRDPILLILWVWPDEGGDAPEGPHEARWAGFDDVPEPVGGGFPAVFSDREIMAILKLSLNPKK